MNSRTLASTLETFLNGCNGAVVMEDGATVFNLGQAKYSVSGENNKCLIHLWSEERNMVRRVLDAEVKGETLRVTVQKLGQNRPSRLDICRDRDPRTATAKHSARLAYQRTLERALKRGFPDLTVAQLSNAVDLEKSFGPIYTRGLLRRGRTGFAVLGVNRHEPQSSIDAALTFGLLWLDVCRAASTGKLVIEGLKLFLPPDSLAVARERMAHLNPGAAKWELYELEERAESIRQVEILDRGNMVTRLTRCPDDTEIRARFGGPIALVHSMMPEAEIAALSAAEISFRCHGLEFARSRMTADRSTLRSVPELLFGSGPAQKVLNDGNLDQFEAMVRGIGESRHCDGPRECRWWRLHPERWLESLVVKDVSALDTQLDPRWVYSQVPAFASADRAMIDVLTVTREGRLAVVELKADEDIHLPLQGVDYWSRVAWHHERGEFQKFGYFPGRELSPQNPVLMMVSPALHVHPATDTLLKYLSPSIDWIVLGIDERWRQGVKVLFRKHPRSAECPEAPGLQDFQMPSSLRTSISCPR